jgi:DNA-binding PadR family transcriptional regulator
MSVRHAMLALLSNSSMFGLQLQQEFESRTGNVWPLNVGQVYTTLQRLERDGLIEEENESAKGVQKDYKITNAGRRELLEWLKKPAELDPPPRDELVIKMMVALKVPDIDVRELLQVHRRHLVEAMRQYTRLKAEDSGEDLALALIVDAQLFRLEGIVRWLDSADIRLKQLVAKRSDFNVEVQ